MNGCCIYVYARTREEIKILFSVKSDLSNSEDYLIPFTVLDIYVNECFDVAGSSVRAGAEVQTTAVSVGGGTGEHGQRDQTERHPGEDLVPEQTVQEQAAATVVVVFVFVVETPRAHDVFGGASQMLVGTTASASQLLRGASARRQRTTRVRRHKLPLPLSTSTGRLYLVQQPASTSPAVPLRCR